MHADFVTQNDGQLLFRLLIILFVFLHLRHQKEQEGKKQ